MVLTHDCPPDGTGHAILASDLAPCHWFSALATTLEPRSAPRLAWLFVGAIWLAAGVRSRAGFGRRG